MALTRLKNRGITDSTIANVKLANDSITVNGTAIDLGASDSISAGKVLQVVQGTSSTTVTSTTSSNSYTDTGLSASITPSSTSNKILVLVYQPYHINKSGHNNTHGWIALYRDSTRLLYGPRDSNGVQGLGLYDGTSADHDWASIYSVSHLDSPSTTSSVTYKTAQTSYLSSTFITQKAANDVAASRIVLMEIEG